MNRIAAKRVRMYECNNNWMPNCVSLVGKAAVARRRMVTSSKQSKVPFDLIPPGMGTPRFPCQLLHLHSANPSGVFVLVTFLRGELARASFGLRVGNSRGCWICSPHCCATNMWNNTIMPKTFNGTVPRISHDNDTFTSVSQKPIRHIIL